MNSMFYQNQESIILKARAVIKSFDTYNEFLILGTEKGGCEIFNWKTEKQIKTFNFYYKENQEINFCEFLKEKQLSENCLQIINIGVIRSLTENSSKNKKLYFYAQSRKGDLFICSFEKICSQNQKNEIEFLYKIESNVESFCKFVFCEFTHFGNENEKLTQNEIKHKFIFSLYMPSEKENVLNVFDLDIENNFDENSNDNGIDFKRILGESKAFDLAENKFIEETKDIEKLLKNKEDLIKDFEELTYKDGHDNLNDPIKFYSDNGLITGMDNTYDKKYLILGTENLSVLVILVNSEHLNKKAKQTLTILDNFSLAKLPDNKKAVTTSEVNSIITLRVINNSIFESKDNYKILIGMYSSTITILSFNSSSNKIEFNCEIKNACSVQKPGISTFDVIHFEAKIKNELEEMELGLLEEDKKLEDTNIETSVSPISEKTKVNFMCTGGYDYKIRLYEFEEKKEVIFNYLGALYNGANNIIHKVHFVLEKANKNEAEQNALYLFVAADQKILNIYNIA